MALKPESGALAEMPMRFGDDALLWAAWLYYEDGLTQSDIAQKMGLSRASVNTWLADAARAASSISRSSPSAFGPSRSHAV